MVIIVSILSLLAQNTEMKMGCMYFRYPHPMRIHNETVILQIGGRAKRQIVYIHNYSTQ